MIDRKTKVMMAQYAAWVAVVALLNGVCYLGTEFIMLPADSAQAAWALAAEWAAVMVPLVLLLALIGVWRSACAVVLPIVMGASSVVAYFRYTINVSFTPMVLDAWVTNDVAMAMELVSWQLVACVAASLVVACAAATMRWRIGRLPKAKLGAAVLITMLLVVANHPRLERPMERRVPFVLYATVADYLEQQASLTAPRSRLTRATARHDDSLTVVFVLGESLRADHLSLNGYARQTTPRLEQLGAISLPHVRSRFTHTNASVPQIMTRADSLHPRRSQTESSFATLYQSAGYATAWLGNQEWTAHFYPLIQEYDTIAMTNREKSHYDFDQWLDEALLPPYKSLLAQCNARQLITLHTIGSHWYYPSHYTAEHARYQPTVQSKAFDRNDAAPMINAYDNTVCYTDWFLGEVIAPLTERRAIVFYLSDHGEALGEQGQWLHASESEKAHRPAALIWASASYQTRYHEQWHALLQNAKKPLSTDYLYHTILDAAAISTPYLDAEQSIMRRHDDAQRQSPISDF